MKKILYIVGIIAILVLCGSGAYYFITKTNIDKHNFDIQNNEYLDKKNKECLDNYKSFESESYDLSNDEEINFHIADIKFSLKENSCILFFYSENGKRNGGYYIYRYKIVNQTSGKGVYFCASSINDKNNTKEECEEGYNNKLKDLGIK